MEQVNTPPAVNESNAANTEGAANVQSANGSSTVTETTPQSNVEEQANAGASANDTTGDQSHEGDSSKQNENDPEQNACEEELLLKSKIEKAGELHFVHEGKVYVPRFKKVIVPGYGERTDLELCCDDEIHDYLVATGSGVIKEIE